MGMTNGEKLKEIFPNIEIVAIVPDEIVVTKKLDGPDATYTRNSFRYEWWYAEYKEPTTRSDITENCIACKYDEIEDENGEHCKKCLAGDSQFVPDDEFIESITKSDSGVELSIPHLEPDNCGNYIVQVPTTKNDLKVDCIDRNSIKYYPGTGGYMYASKGEIDKLPSVTIKNDLGVDCIDRQATLDAIIKRLGIKNETYLLEAERAIYQQILAMPSVTPQVPRWIPTSERLPDTDDEVLCWYEYYHQSRGKVLPEYGIGCYFKETSSWFGEVAIGHKVRVIAWMPLPQTYREVEE